MTHRNFSHVNKSNRHDQVVYFEQTISHSTCIKKKEIKADDSSLISATK